MSLCFLSNTRDIYSSLGQISQAPSHCPQEELIISATEWNKCAGRVLAEVCLMQPNDLLFEQFGTENEKHYKAFSGAADNSWWEVD